MAHNPPREYQDEEYCYHCMADTPHTIYDSGHERDSSGDWRICHNCKWRYSGLSGAYHEPYDYEEEEYVYILLSDGDGTLRSIPEPFGVAVRTEEEAKRFVKEDKVGYSQGYEKVRIFDSAKEGIAWKYPPRKSGI